METMLRFGKMYESDRAYVKIIHYVGMDADQQCIYQGDNMVLYYSDGTVVNDMSDTELKLRQISYKEDYEEDEEVVIIVEDDVEEDEEVTITKTFANANEAMKWARIVAKLPD